MCQDTAAEKQAPKGPHKGRRDVGWWRLHSQREPVLHHVEPVEAPPVCGPVHGVVADAGQGFRGAGSKRRSHGPGETGWHQTGPSESPRPQVPPATRLPACPSP